MDIQDRFRGCLLGLAAGDAVGTTVEFRQRGSFTPLTDMVGGGPFALIPGQWTDDTSMALCLATSLLECNGFDAKDQMERYRRWADEGYWSSTGRCFDIGNTVASALHKYRQSGEPFAGSTHPHSAGNGSIMRLAPVAMFYYPDLEQADWHAAQSSRTTHAAQECVDACRLLARVIWRALAGEEKERVIDSHSEVTFGAEKILEVALGGYRAKTVNEIRGSGYVVESLEAALWCFDRTDNYKDAILMAANLGDDADTTAAICGQVAGAFYGESAIPAGWLEKLSFRDEIGALAERLMHKT